MPYAVAAVGVISFLAGLAVAGERYVTAGFLIATASGVGFWLRWYVLSSINQAFNQGAGYSVSTRARIRGLPEAHEVHEFTKKRFMNDA